MDHEYRPTTHRGTRNPQRARRTHPIFNALMAAGFALLGYGALTGAANGPGIDLPAGLGSAVVPASLSIGNTEDPIITGSTDIFAASMFSGPNRAEKRDRARPAVDLVAFAKEFETVRLQLASLRSPVEVTEGPQSHPEVGPVEPAEETPRISVAAIGPLVESEALDAIDTIAPPAFDGPVPLIQSTKMAYARANTPVTDFTIIRDETGKQVSEKEMWCLATAIYFESRGEKYRGQVAVAQVVMNRLHHRIYPKTICGVVFQNQNQRNACQFSFACDGIPERVTDAKSWKQAEEIARGVVQGTLYIPEVGKATHYHATYVYPHWAPKMKKVTKIGLHVFYQFKAGWRFG